MKKIIPILLLCAVQQVAAQKKSQVAEQQEQITVLQDAVQKQKQKTARLEDILDAQKTKIDSLTVLTQATQENNKKLADELGVKIQNADSSAKNSISKLDKDVSANRLYWIIGTLATLLLGGLLYWLLGRRIVSSKTDVESQIKNTKKTLEEESVKLDNKLVEVLESQLKIKHEEVKAAPQVASKEIDHSLALKVADEIVRMQKNISKMDEDTKGLKPLLKGIERIQANFASNGYEMVNLLNKDYDERMNIDVINFITDSNLTEGRKIITSVIKPQVNYNGVLIQRAQVDVSQN